MIYLVTGGQAPRHGERWDQSIKPFSAVCQRRDMRNGTEPRSWYAGAFEPTGSGSMKVLAQPFPEHRHPTGVHQEFPPNPPGNLPELASPRSPSPARRGEATFLGGEG